VVFSLWSPSSFTKATSHKASITIIVSLTNLEQVYSSKDIAALSWERKKRLWSKKKSSNSAAGGTSLMAQA